MRLPTAALILALAAAPALLAAAPGAAAPAKPAPKAAPTLPPSRTLIDRQIPVAAGRTAHVTLENVRGRVVVRSWDGSAVIVRAQARATHPVAGEEARLLADAKVEIGPDATDTVRVLTTFPASPHTSASVLASHGPHVAVDYTLVVPKRAFVSVRQEYGDVVAHAFEGRLRLFSRDGAIAASAVRGRVEAENERGAIELSGVEGDAVGKTQAGSVRIERVTGDLRAASTTGDVWVDVPARFAGEVAFHTVSGTFHSDLATFGTEVVPGDAGWVGVLRGPLADQKPPVSRYRIETVSGRATVALKR